MQPTATAEQMLDLDEALRPYQREGVSFLFRSESAFLADEMGLGKTVQALTALRLLLRQPNVNRALIVAPASLTLNWQRECERWAPELVVRRLQGPQVDRLAYYQLPIQVLIASYEQISLDALDRIPDNTFDVVILDEAQRIKNYSSRTALACRLLPRHVAWALTGTPIENARADIESIFAFVRPGLIEAMLESASAAGSKVLVFSQYVETLKWLAEAVDAVPTAIYSGKQPTGERDDVLTAFEQGDGSRALLMSLRAGGVGLNIPSADLVVLFDRWWNPAVEAQAVNRAHRLGRTTPLHVVRFLVRDSIEERIDEILSAKQELFDDYVEAVDVPDIPALTRNDLIHALGVSHYDTDAEPAVVEE
jgi:SNF2 family DNA or RNA helicase